MKYSRSLDGFTWKELVKLLGGQIRGGWYSPVGSALTNSMAGANSATRAISRGSICVGIVKTTCAQQQKQSSSGYGFEPFWGASSQNACDQKSTTRRSYAAEPRISSAATIMTLRQSFIDMRL